MFVAADHQTEILQNDFLSPHHRDILQIQQSRCVHSHCLLSLDDDRNFLRRLRLGQLALGFLILWTNALELNETGIRELLQPLMYLAG